MDLYKIVELNLDNEKDREIAENELRNYFQNDSTFDKNELIRFVNLYYKYSCYLKNIKCDLVCKRTDFPFLAFYSLENDNVVFNTNLLKDIKLNNNKQTRLSFDNICSFAFMIEHELRHKQQTDEMFCDFKNDEQKFYYLSPNILLMVKEFIAINFFDSFANDYGNNVEGNVYTINHDNMVIEIDANYNAFINTYNNLLQFNEELAKKFFDKNYKSYSKDKSTLNNTADIIQKDIEIDGNDSEKKDFYAQYKYSLICDYAVKNDCTLLKDIPLLNIMYKEDGQKRSYQELMQIQNTMWQQKNIEVDSSKPIDIIDILVENDPILIYQKQLSNINKDNFNVKALTDIAEILFELSNKLDGRYFEDFHTITRQELLDLSNQYNIISNSDLPQSEKETELNYVLGRRKIIQLLFDDIVEQNERMAKIQRENEKKKEDAITLLNNQFNIDVTKVDLQVNDDIIKGKFKYSKEDLQRLLNNIKDDLTDEEYDKINNAIDLVRPYDKLLRQYSDIEFNKEHYSQLTKTKINNNEIIKTK